jgi:hypothetical protein
MPSLELETTLLAGNIMSHYDLLVSRNNNNVYDDDYAEGDESVICLHGNLTAQSPILE